MNNPPIVKNGAFVGAGTGVFTVLNGAAVLHFGGFDPSDVIDVEVSTDIEAPFTNFTPYMPDGVTPLQLTDLAPDATVAAPGVYRLVLTTVAATGYVTLKNSVGAFPVYLPRVPTGGAPGQFLTRTGNGPLDIAWRDLESSDIPTPPAPTAPAAADFVVVRDGVVLTGAAAPNFYFRAPMEHEGLIYIGLQIQSNVAAAALDTQAELIVQMPAGFELVSVGGIFMRTDAVIQYIGSIALAIIDANFRLLTATLGGELADVTLSFAIRPT